MSEKGLTQDETWEEESDDETLSEDVPMTTSRDGMPTEDHTLKETVIDDTDVPTVAGDLKPEEPPRPLTEAEEAGLASVMDGIEPWNGVLDPPEPGEQKDQGPDVQDVTGDLNPDDPLTHGHMPI